MKICVFQMSASIEPDARIDRIETAMSEAAGNGADLLVAPELALTGYGRGDVLTQLAQPRDGPMVKRLTATAANLGISLVAGFPERVDDVRYISALIINHTSPDDVHIYRKGCLYGDYEKGLFAPNGPTTVLINMHGLTLGFLICYDIEFPENARRLALAGADMIVVPTALPLGNSAAFIATHAVPVRAFENQIFIAYADNADTDDGFTFQGLSSIAAPDGAVLASAPVAGDAMLYADIDPAAYANARVENPYLKDVLLTI